jgi:hypothetical protein
LVFHKYAGTTADTITVWTKKLKKLFSLKSAATLKPEYICENVFANPDYLHNPGNIQNVWNINNDRNWITITAYPCAPIMFCVAVQCNSKIMIHQYIWHVWSIQYCK